MNILVLKFKLLNVNFLISQLLFEINYSNSIILMENSVAYTSGQDK